MNCYQLTKDAAFDNLNIPAPAKLESTADYAQLMQHMVSVFHPTLNLYYAQHGYEARQQMLSMMVLFLSELLPVRFPSLVRNYPASLDRVYAMIGELLVTEDSVIGAKAG